MICVDIVKLIGTWVHCKWPQQMGFTVLRNSVCLYNYYVC